ncbi:hypothetical protein BH23CHL10_BH23CHL10_12670 [soil metagenome]
MVRYTITQCNDSSYGGGQEDFNCIATGSVTASLDVTVNQCNNSNYGGGSWLNCSANLTTSFVAGGSSATPTPSESPSATPETSSTGPTAPPGDSSTGTPAPSLPDTSVGELVRAPGMGSGPMVLVSLVFLAAISLMTAATWNNRVTR